MKTSYHRLIIIAMILLCSCHKEKHYRCMCFTKLNDMETYNLGRMDETAAYAKCKTYDADTTIDHCIMEIRK